MKWHYFESVFITLIAVIKYPDERNLRFIWVHGSRAVTVVREMESHVVRKQRAGNAGALFPVSTSIQSGPLVCDMALHTFRVSLCTSQRVTQLTLHRQAQKLVSLVIHPVKFQD